MNLEDIARKAGVSRSTVSRVINESPHVSDRTRARVLAIIEQEGFSPNPGARMMVLKRTQVLGILIPTSLEMMFEDPYFYPTLLQGVSDGAQDRDYALMLWLGNSSDDPEYFYQRMLRNRLVDGWLIASVARDFPLLERLLKQKVPFVVTERPGQFEDQICYVSVDNVEAARKVVQYLIGLGRTRIATITGTLNNADSQDRLEGYRQALRQAELPYDASLVVNGRYSRRYAFMATQQLLRQGAEFDAIFAANDGMATGAMSALQEAGLHVPEDVAVVGFDDWPVAAQTVPALTTVRHPLYQKGFAAVNMLIDLVEGAIGAPHQVILPTQFVIRESSGAAVNRLVV
ncbi:MAG: LacI family DNA-binding transcriptional regulator [Anaerolineae bacterium]|nr:LacI family DNA-binding transcriptional regulator [Anaerolineae bacterium]